MNDHSQFESALNTDYSQLALWLQRVLQGSSQAEERSGVAEDEARLELLLGSDYHLSYYQQLPDFIMALLNNEPTAPVHYAPLLYHLAGCRECHKGYVELYDAMHAAIQPQRSRSMLGQGTRTLAATPQRMLGHLCQTLISQAEAVLYQSRHTHTDDGAIARSQLQLAIGISAHITQHHIRRLALSDLVRVATLFEGPSPPHKENPHTYRYVPVLTGSGGMRGGKKVVRHTETFMRSPRREQPIIHLQSHSLEGSIVQHEQVLELRLRELDEALRGQHILVSILLGTLIEPVRWVGGNPHAIHSATPVDTSGMLVMPLGETELQLGKPEDHNLLEAIFLHVEVRATD